MSTAPPAKRARILNFTQTSSSTIPPRQIPVPANCEIAALTAPACRTLIIAMLAAHPSLAGLARAHIQAAKDAPPKPKARPSANELYKRVAKHFDKQYYYLSAEEQGIAAVKIESSIYAAVDGIVDGTVARGTYEARTRAFDALWDIAWVGT